MKNNIGSLLSRRAGLNPHREAYVDSQSGLRLTFEQLNERCNRVANSLLKLGIVPGERVAIAMMNSAEFIETYFAIAKIGGVIVPLNWRLVPDELEFILKDSGSRTVLYGEEFHDVMVDLQSRGDQTEVRDWIEVEKTDAAGEPVNNAAIAAFADSYLAFRERSPADEPELGAANEDLLYIMYTSGTTGLPKGVVHSHRTCMWALNTIAATCDIRGGDRNLVALPLFHVGSLSPVTLNIYWGGTSVVMREFNPQRAWELFGEEKINSGLLVPAMLNFMMQVENLEQYDFSELRWIQSGASPLPVNLIEKYFDIGIEIHQVYGLTESCGPACVISAEHAISKKGSTGRAFFHTDARVVDDNGQDCPPNEQGELWISGEHVMVEYWNRPEATAESISPEGWLKTGDVACKDEEGFVYIQDRIKDMIISGGENVYPAEIENVILSHGAVAEVAVIGQPSAQWGESPVAIVVSKDDSLSAGDIIAHCQGKLARFKIPKAAEFIDVIPRNANGKVLKRELRTRFPGPAAE